MEEISNQDLGWKELTPTNFVRFLLGRMPLLRKKGEQHKKVNNIEKTTRIWSHPPTFCYLELDPGYWQKWLLLKRQLLWTLDFLHVSIFSNFLDLHPKSISPKKQPSKDLQTILSGHKSCSFFGKKSRWPGRSTSLEENDRFRSEADFWRFGHRHLHGLMLEGRFWMGFLLLKSWVGWFFFVFDFSPDSDSFWGSCFRKGGRATNHFGGLDVAPVLLQGAVDVVPLLGPIVGCHCSVLWLGGRVTTNVGGVDVVPLLGAIAGCHWRGGWRPTLGEWMWYHCWCHRTVPLCTMVRVGWRPTLGEWTWCHCWCHRTVPLCTMVGVGWSWCHCWCHRTVPLCTMVGVGWRPTLGEWTWCHCWCHRTVPLCTMVGVGWRPTLGEWTWCHCWVPLQGAIVVRYGWGRRVTDPQSGRGAIAGCHCSVLWLGGEGDDCAIAGCPWHPTQQWHREKHPKKLFWTFADVTLFFTLITQKLFFCYLGSMLV